MQFSIPNSLIKTPIIIYKKIGIDIEGKTQYLETFNGKCRMEAYSKQILNINGDVINYNWKIYLKNDIDVVNNSKCIINENEYIIINYDKHLNINGTINYTKLYLI